eukprot:3560813-Rhodomonas_salina.4
MHMNVDGTIFYGMKMEAIVAAGAAEVRRSASVHGGSAAAYGSSAAVNSSSAGVYGGSAAVYGSTCFACVRT